ncbi:MAG TPA: 5-oxoprolinase/urea amidolyase family protein [Steroidobacteraceae bacterium]|nr:5-oxoprolinase/urea amidolyase family protein [Steroidobacteraceae bacterium]
MFDKVLIANRGAIACRILRTLQRLGIGSVAVYSEADAHAPHVRLADEAWCIGPPPAAESYLRQDRILEIARRSGAAAIHPGYGFLSENADFAAACAAQGVAFVGPTPAQLRDFGLKHRARQLAAENELPLLPGSGLLADVDAALAAARTTGYPVMLKSTAGGGGIGMQLCGSPEELAQAFGGVQRLARGNFGDGGLLLEKYVANARHIEVQLFGDGRGNVVALGERDCSMQRRNQKVVEETPAPGLTDTTRARLHAAALRLGRAVQYRSAGTVEFIYDAVSREFWFLEVNTRLQVEHGVTEETGGMDLVEWMLRVAAGQPPDLATCHYRPRGHAVQVRLYAEDAARAFRPSSGLLTEVLLPEGVRVDGWIETGTEVGNWYDPMLAKIIAHGATREEAIARLRAALARTRIHGIETNLPFLQSILGNEEFLAGRPHTRLLAGLDFSTPGIEVLNAGTLTTVQDWPGRLGYWDVGVPPSGPMDERAFRLANRMLGNDAGEAALEMTATGATLRFACGALVALTGAAMPASLDGAPVAFWEPVRVAAGSVLKLGAIQGAGQRSYLAVQGGFDLPMYLGSRATFTLGGFGGHGGRALRAGDVLRMKRAGCEPARAGALPQRERPVYGSPWIIRVRHGPHGAPDFFTAEDIESFFATDWEVHYNSSRTGVRLIGPKPRWARADGGEAGLHPSNIHDSAYAVGAIDFTGDMPVILGPDGPSLGGFVCPATICLEDLWMTGQLRPGDRVRFVAIAEEARSANPAVLETLPAGARHAAICIRQCGEDHLLVEFGPPVLDLELRFQVQALLETLRARAIPGMLDLTPGIRSLQLHFDPRRLPRAHALQGLRETLGTLPDAEQMVIPSRVVHLPLCWNDPATQLATQRYMQSVRADAPWCPDNIEFIRRINGLDSVEDVRRIVFEASYLVMGLGDVYLGAPVATPLDPRHRLVTTKYNPARTWTPENAVGIGGAYLCVYGMEGPGGYQFVGRTVQMWNRWRQTEDFRGKPWLLRFFDQLRFYPVGSEELLQLREEFPYGGFRLRVEESTLRLAEYRQFLAAHADSIQAFRERQQQAFAAERQRWQEAGLSEAPAADAPPSGAAAELPRGSEPVHAPVTGSLWQLHVSAGQRVSAGEELLVMEAMKMEVSVRAESAGVVTALYCEPGRPVRAGDLLLAINPADANP